MRKICLLLLTALLFCGCGIEKQSPKKLKSLDFTVLAPEEMPEELLNVLEEKKTSPIRMKDICIFMRDMENRKAADTALR